jgi:hypothetical protein
MDANVHRTGNETDLEIEIARAAGRFKDCATLSAAFHVHATSIVSGL